MQTAVDLLGRTIFPYSSNFDMNTQAVISHIVQWLKQRSETTRTEGFVVGVSGGIDSAVTASLVAKTGLSTLCCEMPIHQPVSHLSRSREHITSLERNHANVSSVRIELTPVFDTWVAALPAVAEAADRDLTLANARARIRMTTLYYFAGLHRYLVAGTGNKVEDFGVGFFTKYGDGGVDLSPIADLVKTEVYALGEALGVNQKIMDAAPTDGLWGDDRSDEDQIGASYPELEWAMTYESGATAADLTHRQQEVLETYRQYHTTNRHKMEPIPVCLIPDSIRNHGSAEPTPKK